MRLTLEILEQEAAVVRLAAWAELPVWFDWRARTIASVTRTVNETSIVFPAASVPEDDQAERGWRMIKVRGPLPFSLTGILLSILTPLAAAEISIFALSTYDTDYVLVRSADMTRAVAALRPTFDIIPKLTDPDSSVALSSWPGLTRPSAYIGTVVPLRLMAGSAAGHDG